MTRFQVRGRRYESLIDAMTNDPKDRHVLAAAVRANTEVIVTSGRWWSATDGGHVGYESRLERDHVMLLDFDPTVVGIARSRSGCPGRRRMAATVTRAGLFRLPGVRVGRGGGLPAGEPSRQAAGCGRVRGDHAVVRGGWAGSTAGRRPESITAGPRPALSMRELPPRG
ncbi:MAG TPA: hypothetical protein VFR23_23220 [Jiangellaceae bacterium]|nr:hypothetical protein [Jiangellaceae bacterium]